MDNWVALSGSPFSCEDVPQMIRTVWNLFWHHTSTSPFAKHEIFDSGNSLFHFHLIPGIAYFPLDSFDDSVIILW